MVSQAHAELGMMVRSRQGPAKNVLFKWNPESGKGPPSTTTFTRASIASVLTTTDGTTNWYQETKSGELRLDGLRRVENFNDEPDATTWDLISGAVVNGDRVDLPNFNSGLFHELVSPLLPLPGSTVWAVIEATGDGTILLTARTDNNADSNDQVITLTSTPTIFAVKVDFTSASAARSEFRCQFRKDPGGLTATFIKFEKSWFVVDQSGSTLPPSYVEFATTYNANVAGVRYLTTYNANTVDGNGVVTEATGTTITGGGYLPEPAATNRIVNVDPSAWTESGELGVTNDGVNDLGLTQYTLDAGTSTGQHRRFNTASGSDAAGSMYAYLKQGTGRYGVVKRGVDNATDYAVFDLQAGTITEEGSGIDEAIITLISNGWYKCEINTSDTNRAIFIGISDTATPGVGNPSFTGSNETILYCHSQYENTVYSTSPIVTTAGALTRVADALTDSTAFTLEHSAVFDTTFPTVMATSIRAALMSYSSGVADRFTTNSNNGLIYFVNTGLSATATASTSLEGERHKSAFSAKSGELIVINDEGDSDTDSSGTPGTGTINIGYNGGSSEFFRGRMHVITIYSVSQTQSELEGLVA